jgi:Skp family chaperone for outer membrane proteins
MKKIILFSIIIAGWLALGGIAPAAEAKIGLVDLDKVFASYYKTIQSNLSIRKEAAEMQNDRKKMLEDAQKHSIEWQKLVDKANDQAASADARDASKREADQKYLDLEKDKEGIKQFDQIASTRLHEKEIQRRDDIVKEIRQILNADAKSAGYTLVLDVSGESHNMIPVVIYTNGQNDMTDALIKELNSTAPPGALDVTNSVPDSALNGGPGSH